MIIPSIDIMNGRAVQLRQGKELVLDGGDPMDRLSEFAPLGEVAVVDLDAALGRGDNRELIRAMIGRGRCRVGGGIRTVGAARDWLDAGATRVMIGTSATPAFCAALPRDRVVAAVDARRGRVVVDGWRRSTRLDAVDAVRELAPHVGGILLTQVEHEGGLAGYDHTLIDRARAAAAGVRITAAGGISTAGEIAALDRDGIDAQVGMALYSGTLGLAEAFAAPLVSNRRDGLWPTVVADESGEALGLAWSSVESLRMAIAERRGVYWSRSRRALWRKGETSGNVQRLVRVDADCDRDALRFVVTQSGTGDFCHLGERRCWPGPFSLGGLERRIATSAGDGESHTARLLADGGLLAAKLVEEAAELARATSRDDVVHEAADVLYFVLVAMRSADVSLEDVRAELERRALRVRRRPMRAKPAGADARAL